ncbi:S41 family peptidase [Chitinimonas koreensis]|uniref:S41 family peptidase n=1 Tax=Chitinimonas koreensis TaxID=356302 RepID=UPI0004061205|nr:S41 family peptidase [Chitinimonas koreensis]QNM95566.1 PDZ domain-containing protein [Chitinimonas koreensis]
MKPSRLAVGLAGLFAVTCVHAAPANYLRFPGIGRDQVVFTAEGDLWAVPNTGGEARRLTSHPAEESRAAVSPDGRWVAFSAAYEGPLEVYVMPLAGGLPKRVSFDNNRAQVLGWSPQGEVLYSAQHTSGPASQRMVAAVQPQTLARRVFPLADANDAVLDERGEWLYFTRFGLATTGDNARGYRGGAQSQLWRYNLRTGAEAERIGPRDANPRRPMWWNGRLIVISDRDGQDNLWSLAADGSDARQLTRHAEFGVRAASQANGKVAYQLGADLRVFDLAGNSDAPLDVALVSDFDQQRNRWIERPLRYLSSARLGADGERVALTIRGRAVLAGSGPLRRVDIDQPAGSRLRNAVPSSDGKWVYAISDQSGEQEIWRYPADGGGNAKQLTQDGAIHRWKLYPSPDGKWLAHDDKRGRLWLLELASGRNTLIDDGSQFGNEEYAQVAWSADSRAIALVRQNSVRQLSQIGLYSLERKRTDWLTSDKYDSAYPAFSPDGKWLYFLSDRSFQLANRSPWGDRNTGPYLADRTKIYALALQAGARFPFQPKDELQRGKAGADKDDDGDGKDEARGKDDKPADDKDKKDAKPRLPAIAWEGLADRLYEVPLQAGNYRELQTDGKRLYYLESDSPSDSAKAALKSLAIDNESPKPETFALDVAEFALAQKAKKLFFRKAGEGAEMYIVEAAAKTPSDLTKAAVRMRDWTLQVNPRAEWRQIFGDAWRMHRDFFFDRTLRGVDWAAVRRKYAPLVERVNDRSELDDVLGQMIGELGALHSQIGAGDVRVSRDAAQPAGLGAQLERVDGGWKVVHIYRTERELPNERAPLDMPGVDVDEGDVITAVNGRASAEVRDFSDLLRNQAGQQVLLEVKRGKAAAHRTVVVPVDARTQQALRYTDWEQTRKEAVEQAGGGKLGYLHLRAMGPADMAAFVREFYGQYDRDGLIIDVRRNNGGSIDSWVIEKLLRRPWAYWAGPTALPAQNMQQAFRGHLVVLTDALTYSDGETFAAGVKALKLGPVIGNRTAGAGVWLSDRNDLVDDGLARVAESPQYGIDGSWLVEGIGVAPDVEVDNPPVATFKGEDRQLEAAIGYLQKKLQQAPVPPLKPRPIPPLHPPVQQQP